MTCSLKREIHSQGPGHHLPAYNVGFVKPRGQPNGIEHPSPENKDVVASKNLCASTCQRSKRSSLLPANLPTVREVHVSRHIELAPDSVCRPTNPPPHIPLARHAHVTEICKSASIGRPPNQASLMT